MPGSLNISAPHSRGSRGFSPKFRPRGTFATPHIKLHYAALDRRFFAKGRKESAAVVLPKRFAAAEKGTTNNESSGAKQPKIKETQKGFFRNFGKLYFGGPLKQISWFENELHGDSVSRATF